MMYKGKGQEKGEGWEEREWRESGSRERDNTRRDRE
jgi:hypothetical protein